MNSLDVTVLYEDKYILLIDKPSGLVVNTSDTAREKTLQESLHEYLNIPFDKENEFKSRGGLVHRLDKDTSGVLLVAKNEDVFFSLKDQFMSREVEKKYIAIVHGKLEQKNIRVNAPIGRNPKNRMSFAIVKSGKDAVSEITLLKTIKNEETSKWYSLVEVLPRTGRTHQIRVHLLALKHPVVGDTIYSTKTLISEANKMGIEQLLLHARSLRFTHPVENKSMTVDSDIPQRFFIIENLQK